MFKEKFFNKEWCDMVFENQNKDYGAYKLRKETGRRYFVALLPVWGLLAAIITGLIVLVIAIYAWNLKFETYNPAKDIPKFEGIQIKEAKPERRPAPKSDPKMAEKDNMQSLELDPDPMLVTVIADDPVDPDKIEELPLDSLKVLEKEKDLTLVEDEESTKGAIIEERAKFPGGIAAWAKWVTSFMVYPPACEKRGIEGNVTMTFDVAPDGRITNMRITNPADSRLNAEAMRILRNSPKWEPATKNGQPVLSRCTQTICFRLLPN